MADPTSNSPAKPRPIRLKYLDRVENLNKLEIAAILKTIRFWVYDFYNQAAGTAKVNGNFRVRGFALEEFDLSTSSDLASALPNQRGQAPDFNREPYLFMCDLVHFVEQTYRPVPNQFGLTLEQINQLNRLTSLFEIFQVTPNGRDEIEAEDLKRMEDFNMRQHILRRIDEIVKILNLEKEIEQAQVPESKSAPSTTGAASGGAFSLPFPGGKNRQPGDTRDDSSLQQQPDESRRRRTDEPAQQPSPQQPLKLSELDPQAKLYLQSLSIITINQALSRYFNDASLKEMGLAPGTRVTFDQLPLNIRQQLMDRAFLQVETLLLSGQFELGGESGLIQNSSARINFANQTALNLLIDVHGMRLIHQVVGQLVKPNNQAAFKKELEKNQQQELKSEQLSERVKNQTNVLDTKSAEEVLTQNQNSQDYARLIESKLNIIGDEKYLDKALMEELASIIGRRDLASQARIVANARSIVEVYIQQGLPPEYLIPNPSRFDYSKFVNVFGKELSQKQFEDHKIALANLIISYWKRKRAIWAKEIRQEFSQEKYTPEEAALLAKKADPRRLAKEKQLRTVNFVHGGRQAAQVLANPTSEEAKNNSELAGFLKQQQDLIGKQLEAELAKKKPEEQQVVLKTYFEFYMPGFVAQEYSLQIFSEKIVPQISPMDYYMIQANQALEERAFAREGDGFLQQAFGQRGNGLLAQALSQIPGGSEGDDLIDNRFTREALKWGIRAAAGAASGGASEAAFASWETAKASDPTGTLQLIEKEVLSKIFDFLKKNWPWLLALLALATLGPLIAALMAVLGAGFALAKAFGGAKNIIPGLQRALGGQGAGEGLGLSGKEAFDQLAASRGGGAPTFYTTPPAQSLVGQLASPAMIIAGQAVVVTAGASLFFMYMYQANLNSAFLTDFPYSESEIVGNIEKESKYAEISKTAKITKGCLLTENNGTKCESPSFPISIEYTVTIKPKEDFSIQITDIKDEISFKQSQKGWEEAGQTPPIIPSKKDLNFDYFISLLAAQGNVGSPPLSVTPTPLPGENEPSPTPSGTSPEGGEIVIPAGGSLTFTYTLDDLSSDYNHTAIQNIIEVNFYYQNDFIAGTDKVITAARICLGECSGDVGCWPMTGNLSQMPFDSSYSHAPNSKNSRWHDAFDLGTGLGDVMKGNNVYVPYDGELCFKKCTNDNYGCYYVLSFNDGVNDQQLLFAHFEEPIPQLPTDDSCMQVQAGQLIDRSGNRGFSDGNHLHYAAAHNEIFSLPSYPGYSIITDLVPEDDKGQHPPVKGNTVTTCYE